MDNDHLQHLLVHTDSDYYFIAEAPFIIFSVFFADKGPLPIFEPIIKWAHIPTWHLLGLWIWIIAPVACKMMLNMIGKYFA